MAIAGIVVTGLREQMAETRKRLEGVPGLAEIHPMDDAKWAAVLEAPSESMETALSDLKDIEGVLTVDLAFLSYEDDLADRGTIPCPPHKPRRRTA